MGLGGLTELRMRLTAACRIRLLQQQARARAREAPRDPPAIEIPDSADTERVVRSDDKPCSRFHRWTSNTGSPPSAPRARGSFQRPLATSSRCRAAASADPRASWTIPFTLPRGPATTVRRSPRCAHQYVAMWMTDESHVRRVIHDFNERGMTSLDPDYRGGRPRRITDENRRAVVAVAGARPDSQGVALTRWSLPRLADHLVERGVLQISPAHPGRVLAEAGLSFQRTRTCKASPDPDYEPEAARILELKAAPPPARDRVRPGWGRSAPGRPPAPAGPLASGPSDSEPPTQTPRHALRLRRLRPAPRPPTRPAQTAPTRQRQPRLHDPDPHRESPAGGASTGSRTA